MFLLREFDKYFYDTFLSLEANFSCVFFEDKFFNCERLIYVKNTKKINAFTYFYKKALFILCIKLFVDESFKLNEFL